MASAWTATYNGGTTYRTGEHFANQLSETRAKTGGYVHKLRP